MHDGDYEKEGRERRSRAPKTEILYRDDDLFVVNKAPGIVPDRGRFDEPGVLDELCPASSADAADPISVYPLEAELSGLMIWARHDRALAQLQTQFSEQRLTVTYLAVVRATVLEPSGVIDRPIRIPDPGGGHAIVDLKRGLPAVTEWRLRDRYVGFALLECIARTRIAQQIRVHLADAGLPLAVDPSYGGAASLMLSSFKAGYRPSRRRPERPLIQRPSLHAASVSFEHPGTAETLQFEAPPPKDFRATLHQLDRFGRIPNER